jgi:hypothetical protein
VVVKNNRKKNRERGRRHATDRMTTIRAQEDDERLASDARRLKRALLSLAKGT